MPESSILWRMNRRNNRRTRPDAIRALTIALALFVVPLGAAVVFGQKGGEDETGPYLVVDGWMKPFARPGYIQASQGGVFAESANRIFVVNRGELELPPTLPTAFNGAWGSTGQKASDATADSAVSTLACRINRSSIPPVTTFESRASQARLRAEVSDSCAG